MENQNNLNKNEEKRTLEYSSTYSMFALFFALLLIFYPFFKDSKEIENKIHKARAESIAYQVAARQMHNISAAEDLSFSSKKRGPASADSNDFQVVGKISRDAKGAPMEYEISQSGGMLKVNVWSADQKSPKTEVLIPQISR